AILLLLPLIFITILGTSTGQLFALKEKAKKIKVGIVNADQKELSALILTEVELVDALTVEEFPDMEAARKKMEQGEFDVTVYIGPEYTDRVEALRLGDLLAKKGLLKDELTSLDVKVESSAYWATAKQVVEKLVFGFAYKTFVPQILRRDKLKLALELKREANKIDEESDAAEAAAAAAGTADTAKTELQQIADRIGEQKSPINESNFVYQIIVPSYTVMFVFFIVMLMARSMIEERDLGTLNRLRMSPATQAATIIGKTVPFLIVSVIQTILLFIAGRVFFSMSWGVQPWVLLPVIVCTSMSAVGLGLLVATTARTDAQVSAYGNFLVLTMAGLSGCMMPRQWQPPLMQKLGLVTPHAWSLIAYDQLLTKQYPEFQQVAQSCGMLLAFAAVFFALGWWRFRSL
ncbi:MAG: ABC transporter permease, partial [Planctomycetota bacterium]|nr:ABC transporter permease [Planctomycetota bacterium]